MIFRSYVGLAAKNAIRIVESARTREDEGQSAIDRGRAGGLPAAVATDPDDLDFIHRRGFAVGACDRRRRGNAPSHGNRSVRRHDRRDAVRAGFYTV